MSKPIPALRALAVAAAGAAAFTLSTAAVAQETPAPTERIEVTGSLIKRVEAETSLPVEVVTREQIERLGATNAEQIILNLTSNSVVGGLIGAQNAGSFTLGQAAISLRGMGSQRTLVLVNGRRLADFPGAASSASATSVDLNAIPVGAIERIEILQDGASSAYGSDAVAGVMNVILRKNYKGIEASAYLGTPTRPGGGQTEKIGTIMGFGDYDADRYNVMLAIDGEHNKALYGRDRNFSQQSWDPVLSDTSATPSGNVEGAWTRGLPYNSQPVHGAPGFGNVLDPTDRFATGGPGSPLGANTTGTCAQAGPGMAFDVNFAGAAARMFSPLGTCRYNPAPLVPLEPTIDRMNVVQNFSFKLNDSTKLFEEFLFTHTKTDLIEQPSPYNTSFFTNDLRFKPLSPQNPFGQTAGPGYVDPAFLIMPGTPTFTNVLGPWLQTPGWAQGNALYTLVTTAAPGTKGVSVTYRAFEGGPREHTDAADQYRLTFGVTGTALDWDYDLTIATNKSRVEEDTESGYQSQFALAKLLNNTTLGQTTWNPWSYPQNPALAAAINATNYNGVIDKSSLETNGVDAHASRGIFDLPGGPLQVALGVTFRRETISLTPGGPIPESGDVSGYGTPIIAFDNGRNVTAGYGEIVAPIIKMVELDASVRTDHYPSIGTQTSPKGSLRIHPTNQLLLRGSVGKGFRAPSLPELYTPGFLGTSRIFTDPVSGIRAQFPQFFGGNPHLQSEKSTQNSFGFVFEPVKGVSLAVDYFAVRLSHFIGTIDPLEVILLEQAGNSFGTCCVMRPTPTSAPSQITTTNLNLGDLKVSGAEVNARWRSPAFSFGHVSAVLTGTYMDKFDQVQPDGSVQGSIAAITTTRTSGVLLSALGTTGGVIARWKHNLELLLDREDWTLSLTQHFQNGYHDNADNFGNPHDVGSFSTWDSQVTVRPYKELRLGIGVKNIFDRDPPLVAGSGVFFQTGYDPSYYDPRARFVYGTVNYKFK